MEQAIPRAESHNNVLPFTLREDARDATQLIIPSPSFEEEEESPFRETPAEQPRKPFIEANTKAVTLSHLQNDCITPVFSKDNEVTSRTISSSKPCGSVRSGCSEAVR